MLLPSDDEASQPGLYQPSGVKQLQLLESDESDSEQDITVLEKPHSTGTNILVDVSLHSDSSTEDMMESNKLQKGMKKIWITSDESDEEIENSSDKKFGRSNESNETPDEMSSSPSTDTDSSGDSDDESPPIRIFRNKETAMQRSNEDDNQWSDNEVLQTACPQRKPRSRAMPPKMEIKSETQRLLRESAVNLPYFVPERKKLSDFLQRPKIIDMQEKRLGSIPQLQSKHGKTSQVISSKSADEMHVEDTEENSSPNENIKPLSQSKKKKLLESMGIKVPQLIAKNGAQEQNKFDFISLTDETEKTQLNGVSRLMQRFINHSKNKLSSKPKKVHFTIVQKEERADGTGCDLVNNVVVAAEPVKNMTKDGAEPLFSSCGGNYHKLRDKLNAKMKQRRMQERIKREAIQRIDNEEVDESEEELSDEWSESESDGELDVERNKPIPVIDDEESEDTSTQSNSAPSFQNASPINKTESSLPQFTREGSMLLFDDSVKRLNCSREELSEQSYDNLYGSMIPPNQPELSDISDCSKPKINFDEDSIFNVAHSPNTSVSQSRGDGESQFIDSDGFIKEAKSEKSLNFLPPGAEDDNANDCNMSQLLELCSGKFQESAISEDHEGFNGNESFGFQVNKDTTPAFSDKESCEESDEEGITIIRKKKQVSQALMRDFLEEEAELSGSDMGSDEEDDGHGDFYEEEENDEILPKEDVIHNQVNKVHLKQILDEDQRDLDLLQEAFIENNIELRRKRKFRWKNIDSSLTEEMFSSGDENDETEMRDGNEESQWRKMRLEREEYLCSQSADMGEIDEDSQLLKLGKNVITSRHVLSEVNEDSKNKPPLLTRSTSLQPAKTTNKFSFLKRNATVLSKFANFKEANFIQGPQNSDKMVFKIKSPRKITKRSKSNESLQVSKKPRLDEDSNSIFDVLDI